MPVIVMTILKTIGGTLLSMLTSVLFSPKYIKRLVMLGLEKLKDLFREKKMETAEKAVEEAEEILRQDPDIGGKQDPDLADKGGK